MRSVEPDGRGTKLVMAANYATEKSLPSGTRPVTCAPWHARSVLALLSFVFQRRVLIAQARRSSGDVRGVVVSGAVRGGVARLVTDRLALTLWNGLGFAGWLEALLAGHGWGASNIRARLRERIRSIAYTILSWWSGDCANTSNP